MGMRMVRSRSGVGGCRSVARARGLPIGPESLRWGPIVSSRTMGHLAPRRPVQDWIHYPLFAMLAPHGSERDAPAVGQPPGPRPVRRPRAVGGLRAASARGAGLLPPRARGPRILGADQVRRCVGGAARSEDVLVGGGGLGDDRGSAPGCARRAAELPRVRSAQARPLPAPDLHQLHPGRGGSLRAVAARADPPPARPGPADGVLRSRARAGGAGPDPGPGAPAGAARGRPAAADRPRRPAAGRHRSGVRRRTRLPARARGGPLQAVRITMGRGAVRDRSRLLRGSPGVSPGGRAHPAGAGRDRRRSPVRA